MLKRDEVLDPRSCWNKAGEGERLFVLLARDAAAPDAIRAWARKRLELGLNDVTDPQIIEALDCADRMEAERSGHRTGAPT